MFVSPMLEGVRDVIQILGVPATVAALVWLIRTWDSGQRQMKDLDTASKETQKMALEIHGKVVDMRDNHLVHMGDEMKAQTGLLTSMDKNLVLIADRLDRPKKR